MAVAMGLKIGLQPTTVEYCGYLFGMGGTKLAKDNY